MMKTLGWVVLLATIVCACGGQKETIQTKGVLVGTLLVVGNEPFTNLTVQSDDRRVRIIQKDTTALYRGLWRLQGKKVRIQFHASGASSDSTHIIVDHCDILNK